MTDEYKAELLADRMARWEEHKWKTQMARKWTWSDYVEGVIIGMMLLVTFMLLAGIAYVR